MDPRDQDKDRNVACASSDSISWLHVREALSSNVYFLNWIGNFDE